MQENSLSKFDQKLGLTVSLISLLVSSLLIVGATMESGGDTVTVLPMLIVFILVGFSLIWYLLRRYRLSNQAYAVDHLNLSIQRWILGFFMVHYGLPKIFGNFFDYQLFALDRPMALASEFEIAWYMFGKNPWHEMFAGVMEFIPGLMLFNRRTYYLGAIILLPVVGQVLIINTFFGIGVFTLVFAIMLMACNLYIVYSQKPAIQGFIKTNNISLYNLNEEAKWLFKLNQTKIFDIDDIEGKKTRIKNYEKLFENAKLETSKKILNLVEITQTLKKVS